MMMMMMMKNMNMNMNMNNFQLSNQPSVLRADSVWVT